MFINRWIEKQTKAYPYNGILVNNTKEKKSDMCFNMDESQNYS